MLEEDLSIGEKLYLARQRLGRSRSAEAAARCVTRAEYCDWEEDRRRGPETKLGGLLPHESYTVLRLRSGLSVGRLSRLLGKSSNYVIWFEQGRPRLGKRAMDVMREFWRC